MKNNLSKEEETEKMLINLSKEGSTVLVVKEEEAEKVAENTNLDIRISKSFFYFKIRTNLSLEKTFPKRGLLFSWSKKKKRRKLLKMTSMSNLAIYYISRML